MTGSGALADLRSQGWPEALVGEQRRVDPAGQSAQGHRLPRAARPGAGLSPA